MHHRTKRSLTALAAVLLLAPLVSAQRPGSIYDPSRGPVSLIADKTARRPGDLVTVLISENQDVRNEETTQLQRQTNLNYALDSFDIDPDFFDPLPDIVATSQDDFNGRANYQKKGEFTARITAMVMDVLPNGNMVITGRREVRIDRETKVIEFSGLIRRFDITPANTVESELVADARVQYIGMGELTNTTNRVGLGGLIHRAWLWLWPF